MNHILHILFSDALYSDITKLSWYDGRKHGAMSPPEIALHWFISNTSLCIWTPYMLAFALYIKLPHMGFNQIADIFSDDILKSILYEFFFFLKNTSLNQHCRISMARYDITTQLELVEMALAVTVSCIYNGTEEEPIFAPTADAYQFTYIYINIYINMCVYLLLWFYQITSRIFYSIWATRLLCFRPHQNTAN